MNRDICTVDHGTGCIDPWAERLRSLGVTIETSTLCPGYAFKMTELWVQQTETRRTIGSFSDKHADLRQSLMGRKSLTQAHRHRSPPFVRVAQLKVAYQVVRVWFDRKPSEAIPDVLKTSAPAHKPLRSIPFTGGRIKSMGTTYGRFDHRVPSVCQYEAENMTDFEVLNYLKPTVLELMPELADARVIDFTVGRYHDFTSFEVGQGSIRPRSGFPIEAGLTNLCFAGDWLHTDYPSALMERAVSTGREAANHVLLADTVRQASLTVTASKGPGFI